MAPNRGYGFGLFILIRNFFLALAPIVLVPSPALQIPTVSLFLIVSLMAQVRFWPWRRARWCFHICFIYAFLVYTKKMYMTMMLHMYM